MGATRAAAGDRRLSVRPGGPLAAGLVALGLLASPVRAQQPDSVARATESAASVAAAWLALLDAGDYGASWDSAAAPFRAALTRDRWIETLHNTRRALEPIAGHERISALYQAVGPQGQRGPFVVVEFGGTGAAGRVVERVVPVLDADGRWRVGGYFIRPAS